MARPTVTINCVADQYANKQTERIIEFSSGEPNGPGGLISIRRHIDTGQLIVEVYQLDEGVDVRVSEERKPR